MSLRYSGNLLNERITNNQQREVCRRNRKISKDNQKLDAPPLGQGKPVQPSRWYSNDSQRKGKRMAKSAFSTGVYPHNGSIRIQVGRHYREILTHLSPNNKAHVREAIKYRDEVRGRLNMGLPPKPPEARSALMIFDDVYQSFIDASPADSSSRYKTILENFWLPRLRGMPISEITHHQIVSIINSKDTHGLKPKTKKNRLSPLSTLFKHFSISPNPCDNVNVGKSQRNDLTDRYTPQERTRLVLAAKGQFQVLVVLLFGCGFRPGEALGLMRDDLINPTTFHVSRQCRQDGIAPLKTRIERDVHIPKWCLPYLRAHLNTLKSPEGWLFLNSQGKHYQNRHSLYLAFQRLHKAANVPLQRPMYDKRDMYVCRHTRASELLSLGVSRGEAAKQLGHSPEMFDRIYARFIGEFTGRTDMTHLDGIGLEKHGLHLIEG